MVSSDVVDALEALGFNLNEGRAYAALLRLGPCTGYEVAQRAGVPRSAVYGALRRLVAAGAARAIAGRPERFVATPAESLLSLLAKRFDASGEALRAAIRDMDVEPAVPDAFSVRGYGRVLEEAARLIGAAQHLVALSGWPREIASLADELEQARARDVYAVAFSHAALPAELAAIRFSYGLGEADLEAFWRHRLVLVVDDRRSLIGATEQQPTDSAVLSETPAIAEFAVGQIALDITLLAQRHQHDVSRVMARLLGDRVGRLDSLLAAGAQPTLGPAPARKARRTPRARRKRKR